MHLNMRRRLPNRRANRTVQFDLGGLSYIATYSLFTNGSLGEVYISNHKSGSAADVSARDAAIACSLALQHGTSLDAIRKALCRDVHSRASGPLGAALDLIAEQLT